MDDKELEFVKRCMSVFIDRKFEELCEAKKGKELEMDDVEGLLEQIKEFVREHFGDVPESFYRKLKDVHAGVHHVLMDKKQPPFRTGGLVCSSLLTTVIAPINSLRNKVMKDLFKKIVEEQLDEMWPEYKDRWRD